MKKVSLCRLEGYKLTESLSTRARASRKHTRIQKDSHDKPMTDRATSCLVL